MLVFIVFLVFILAIVLVASATYFDKLNMVDQANRLIQEGKYEAAITLLEKEILKKSDDPQPFFLLADCHLKYQNYEEALKQYNKIKDQKLLHDQKSRVSLMYNIADTYFNLKQYDNVFNACLQILQMSSEDLKAIKIIAFMLLGNAEFKIALPYLEKLVALEPDDPKNKNAYAVALYETGDTEKAVKLLKEKIEDNPDDTYLSLLYLGMCTFYDRKVAIKYLRKIFPATKNESIIIFLIRLFCFIVYNFELRPTVLEFLKKQIDDPKTHTEARRECTYFLILFLLELRNIGEAKRWINTFEGSYGNYRQLKGIKLGIGLDTSDTEDSVDFESLYKKEFHSLFSKDLVYELSGLKMDRVINIDEFFQEKDNEPVLSSGYQQKSMDSLLDVFCHLKREEFLKFTEKTCKWLHLRIIKMTKHLDEQSIDYVCEHQKTSEKLVASFRQFKKNAKVSDIFLNDLIAKTYEYETSKVVLVTNGELTPLAQKKSESTESIEVLQGTRFYDLLQETLGSVL